MVFDQTAKTTDSIVETIQELIPGLWWSKPPIIGLHYTSLDATLCQCLRKGTGPWNHYQWLKSGSVQMAHHIQQVDLTASDITAARHKKDLSGMLAQHLGEIGSRPTEQMGSSARIPF